MYNINLQILSLNSYSSKIIFWKRHFWSPIPKVFKSQNWILEINFATHSQVWFMSCWRRCEGGTAPHRGHTCMNHASKKIEITRLLAWRQQSNQIQLWHTEKLTIFRIIIIRMGSVQFIPGAQLLTGTTKIDRFLISPHQNPKPMITPIPFTRPHSLQSYMQADKSSLYHFESIFFD